MSKKYSRIISTGSYLPEKILTNYDLEKMVDTSNDWIFERTGINQRHIADENESTVDMAYKASLKSIERSNIKKVGIGYVLIVQGRLKNTKSS